MSKTKMLADAVSDGKMLDTASRSNGIIAADHGGTGLSSPGPNGNVLVSNGTTWTSVTGPIMPLADVEALALAGL